MIEGQRWNQQDGMLWMEKDGLRLVIHPPSAKGYVRFAVIDHRGPNHRPDRLIGSGTRDDVGTAKNAAARMAERIVMARRHRAWPAAVCCSVTHIRSAPIAELGQAFFTV